MKTADHNEKLQTGIKFTKTDLSMNKQGMLSPTQIQTLKDTDYFNGSKTNKLIIGIAIGGVGLGFAKEGMHFFSWQMILAYLGMFGIMYGGYYLYAKTNLKKLEEGKLAVEKIQGKINPFYDEKVANSGSSMGQYSGVVSTATSFAGIKYGDYAYVLEIGGKKLYTQKAVFDAFEKDKEYAIYFARMSKREYQNMIHGAVIVSAEAL